FSVLPSWDYPFSTAPQRWVLLFLSQLHLGNTPYRCDPQQVPHVADKNCRDADKNCDTADKRSLVADKDCLCANKNYRGAKKNSAWEDQNGRGASRAAVRRSSSFSEE